MRSNNQYSLSKKINKFIAKGTQGSLKKIQASMTTVMMTSIFQMKWNTKSLQLIHLEKRKKLVSSPMQEGDLMIEVSVAEEFWMHANNNVGAIIDTWPNNPHTGGNSKACAKSLSLDLGKSSLPNIYNALALSPTQNVSSIKSQNTSLIIPDHSQPIPITIVGSKINISLKPKPISSAHKINL